MREFRCIAVCFDDTCESVAAIEYAAVLGKQTASQIFLLAIFDVRWWWDTQSLSPPFFDRAVTHELNRVASERLRAGLALLARHNMHSTGRTLMGDALVQVPIAVDELSVDLLVVGIRKHSVFKRLFARDHRRLLSRVDCETLFVSGTAARGRHPSLSGNAIDADVNLRAT